MVLTVSVLLGLFFWLKWYGITLRVTSMASTQGQRLSIYATPLICMGILYLILRAVSSFDVRNSSTYLTFYMVMGMAWVGMAGSFFPVMGVSARDDVAERCNPAASYAINGGLIGLTLTFAGGNIGDGPGWWIVVFCAGLATAAWFVLWFLLELAGGISESITVERDESAGLRLSGFLIATGLVLGRAVAGDWHSTPATISDFFTISWPLSILLVMATILERMLAPTKGRPQRSLFGSGMVVFAGYVASAAGYVILRGKW